jgi:hypothetical protein
VIQLLELRRRSEPELPVAKAPATVAGQCNVEAILQFQELATPNPQQSRRRRRRFEYESRWSIEREEKRGEQLGGSRRESKVIKQ